MMTFPRAALQSIVEDRQVVVVIVIVAVFKLLLVAFCHPVLSTDGDAPSYLSFAQSIIGDGAWMRPGAWTDKVLPEYLFRLAGYPFVMAAAMVVGGTAFVPVLLVFQIAVTTITSLVVMGFVGAVVRRRGLRLAVAVAFCLGSPFLYDFLGLSDSLYAALFTVVVFGIAGEIAGCWRFGVRTTLVLGMLWAYSVLVRDAGLYFTILPVTGLLVSGAGGARSMGLAVRRVAVFLLPVLVAAGSYAGLNLYRTNHVCLSISGAVNYLQPVYRIAAAGHAEVLQGDDPVAVAYRRSGAALDYDGMLRTVVAMIQLGKLDNIEATAVSQAKLAETIRRYPFTYIRVVLEGLRFDKQAYNLTNPSYILNDILEGGPWGAGRVIPGFKETFRELRHNFSFGILLTFVTTEAFDLPSLALFALFLVGLPVAVLARYLRTGTVEPRLRGALYLWFGYVAVVSAYGLVFFAIRYMLPVVPLALAAMAIFGETILDARARRSPAP